MTAVLNRRGHQKTLGSIAQQRPRVHRFHVEVRETAIAMAQSSKNHSSRAWNSSVPAVGGSWGPCGLRDDTRIAPSALPDRQPCRAASRRRSYPCRAGIARRWYSAGCCRRCRIRGRLSRGFCFGCAASSPLPAARGIHRGRPARSYGRSVHLPKRFPGSVPALLLSTGREWKRTATSVSRSSRSRVRSTPRAEA